MSDAPQAPGWFQASDGKWYPPAHEAPPAIPQPPSAAVPWWKRPVALWVVLVVGFVCLMLGVAAGQGAKSETKSAAASSQSSSSNSSSSSSATTTTSTTTTTTTAPTTTTTTAPTTTLDPKSQFAADFDQVRPQLISGLEKDNNIESVDKVVFDDPTDSVLIDETSRWASPDNQVDGAWEITRGIAVLWKPDQGFNQSPYVPNLHLVNSGTSYQCSADFMTRLATANAGRSDWEKECAA